MVISFSVSLAGSVPTVSDGAANLRHIELVKSSSVQRAESALPKAAA
jgi:hypothetical protein